MIIFPGHAVIHFEVSSLLSFLTIPVVLLSLYYQRFIVKAWCKLCLITSAILVLQAGLLLSDHGLFSYQPLNFNRCVIVCVDLMTLVSFIAIISLTRGKIGLVLELRRAEAEAARIKNSPDVFSFLLHQQQRIEETVSSNDITIGNPDASIQITMATNLYCGPCKEAHKKLTEIIQVHPDKISLTLRFVQAQNETTKHLLTYWLQNISEKVNQSANTENLLRNWFDVMDLGKFKAQYPISEISDMVDHLAASHERWIETYGINQTPAFFVNGYKLPKPYNIDNLNGLVSGLSHSFEMHNMASHT
jgi:hypothetical protein